MSEKKSSVYKILLLGDSSVGKTCLLMRYTDGTFQEEHLTTIGLDYRVKMVEMDDGSVIKVQFWDTAGQDRYRTITANYYKGANGIILVYDVTNQKTFKNIKAWVEQIKEEVGQKITLMLIGNKIDKEENRTVSKEEGEKLAEELQLAYRETSAKTGKNINEAFNFFVKKTRDENMEVIGVGVKLNSKNKKGKKGCC